jgi:hypothetical protein
MVRLLSSDGSGDSVFRDERFRQFEVSTAAPVRLRTDGAERRVSSQFLRSLFVYDEIVA